MDSDRILKSVVDNGGWTSTSNMCRRPRCDRATRFASSQAPRSFVGSRVPNRFSEDRAGQQPVVKGRSSPTAGGQRSGSRQQGALQHGTLRRHSHMGMPKMDGLEATQVLRSAGPNPA